MRTARQITVEIVGSATWQEREEEVGHNLEVVTDGTTTTIACDPFTAARLAGREIFGRIGETQKELEHKIADAWYAADCPR